VSYVVGVDAGTSAVKAGVYGLDGAALAIASAPVALDRASDGAVTQDLDAIYAAAATATAHAVAAAGVVPADALALAVDGQMAGVGLVDRDHRPVAPYDSWLDSRCGGVLDSIDGDLAARVLASSGCSPTIAIGPKLVWWARERPEVTSRAVRFVTAGGYVAGRAAGLAGDEAFVDPTYLHFTSVADTAAGRWDPDLARAMGVPERLLPRIVPSAEVVGRLTPEAAAAFGLPAGLPVAAGCGDTAASALGAGVLGDGEALDVAGTAAVLAIRVPGFAPDPSGTLLTMRSPLDGSCYALAYVGGAGEIVDWLCRALLGHAAVDDHAYADLARAAAAAPPGSEGLLASPHFSGRICPAAPAMRGSLVGLSPVHGRDHVVRAVLESIAYEYRGYAEAAGAAQGAPGRPLAAVVGTGGGSRLAAWNQIKADVLGAPYTPLEGVEAGTRGAALVAIAAAGAPIPTIGADRYGVTARPGPGADDYLGHYRRYVAWTQHLADGYGDALPAPADGMHH